MQSRRHDRSIVVSDDTVAVTAEGDVQSSFCFSLTAVLRVKAIRRDLITEAGRNGVRFRGL
ncbi:MAG: hypothetical protein JWM68_3239 [Verrucomicrobiales bacterium]|nr:hypothetical protein [Verrucomicrobiales bacterium]